jgi:hypothetical protein
MTELTVNPTLITQLINTHTEVVRQFLAEFHFEIFNGNLKMWRGIVDRMETIPIGESTGGGVEDSATSIDRSKY